MTYELEIEQFKGPLDTLLELIEARKLEITEISLAAVTDDFIRYLEGLVKAEKKEGEEFRAELRIMADFIAIASRLILIKSKSLLPDISLTGEEEAEIKDLENRLALYRELKPAMKLVGGLWQNGNREFGRPYFLDVLSWASAPGVEVFYPGPSISIAGLTSSLQKILEGLEKISSEEATVREEIISIEEKIKEIVGRIQKFGESSLAGLSGGGSRPELIAAFLAILHLAYEQMIFLEQKSRFSDIMVKSNPEYTN